jgi:hypothetical protein
MKRFLFYSTMIVGIIVFYSLCYYFSFRNTLNKAELLKNKQDRNLMLLLLDEEIADEFQRSSSVPPEIGIEVTSDETQIIKSSTVCIYEAYDMETGEILTVESSPTADLAGLTRAEVIVYLRKYMDNLSISEYEAGLISYELVSFSSEKVVFRKNYDKSTHIFKYYITIRNDLVVVYYSDKKTIYEYTGIEAASLTREECVLLENGIMVKDNEELYDILAGLTS